MSAQEQVEVLVVGLGPVGALVSLLLAQRGVRVLGVDQAEAIAEHPRAIALENEALRILQAAGLSDAVETLPIRRVVMRSSVFGDFARTDVSRRVNGHPQLVTFHQPSLERTLRAALRRQASAELRLGTKLVRLLKDERGVVGVLQDATGRRRHVRAAYVVAADGANSTVRRHLGVGFPGRSYPEDWLIVDVLGADAEPQEVEFRCDAGSPAPHMPAPGGRRRWEFMLGPDVDPAESVAPEAIAARLRPWVGERPIQIERRAVYRFHARLAERFSVGRIFLAGDAAHITPPFAGQGLVSGMRDAFNLAWKLAWVVQGKATARLLDSYEQERRAHARATIDLALLIGRMVAPRTAARALLTHGLMKGFHAAPGAGDWLQSVARPSSRLRQGAFAPMKRGEAFKPGAAFPQGEIAQSRRLSDALLGADMTVIVVDGDASLQAAIAKLAAGRGATSVALAFDQLRRWDPWRDAMARPAAPWVVALRPDRVIVSHGPAAAAARVLDEAAALLHAQPSVLEQRLSA